MRNIDKKWALFAIATIVSFYGIFYTLINTTFAIKLENPVDIHFDDMNFYKCVVDAYNLEFSDNVSYDQMLDYEKLKKLTILKCNKNEKSLPEEKIMSVKGIEILSSLENVSLAYNNISKIDLSNNLRLLSLDISYNKLSEIDLSKNEMLQILNIKGNVFVNTLYVYNDEHVTLSDNIKFYDDITWTTDDKDIVNITFFDVIHAKKPGMAIVYGVSDLGYQVINNINVINITSDQYEIDEENAVIYIDNLNKFDIQNINTDDNITLELYISDMKLNVMYNDDILKTFKLIEEIKDV